MAPLLRVVAHRRESMRRPISRGSRRVAASKRTREVQLDCCVVARGLPGGDWPRRRRDGLVGGADPSQPSSEFVAGDGLQHPGVADRVRAPF